MQYQLDINPTNMMRDSKSDPIIFLPINNIKVKPSTGFTHIRHVTTPHEMLRPEDNLKLDIQGNDTES